MSVRPYFAVWCDAVIDDDACLSLCEGETAPTRALARKNARRAGWKPMLTADRRRGDCCPECAREIARCKRDETSGGAR